MGSRYSELLEHSDDVRAWLTLVDEHSHGGLPESTVLAHGRVFEFQPLPEGFAKGKPKRCFMNALFATIEHPELTYCEGFACAEPINFTVHHAWCVTADGVVVDPTWHDKQAGQYIGIPMTGEFVGKTIHKKRTYGVLSWDVEFDPSGIVPDLGIPLKEESDD